MTAPGALAHQLMPILLRPPPPADLAASSPKVRVSSVTEVEALLHKEEPIHKNNYETSPNRSSGSSRTDCKGVRLEGINIGFKQAAFADLGTIWGLVFWLLKTYH